VLVVLQDLGIWVISMLTTLAKMGILSEVKQKDLEKNDHTREPGLDLSQAGYEAGNRCRFHVVGNDFLRSAGVHTLVVGLMNGGCIRVTQA
jgi:hypothetical protein